MHFPDAIRAALHMVGRVQKNGTCQPRAVEGKCGEIDIDVWLEIEKVYETRLSDDEKWWKWYKLIHPEAGDTAINGQYQGNIKFAIIDIPRVQEVFHELWENTSSLPKLSDDAIHAVSTVLEKTVLLMRVAQKSRRTRTNKPKNPEQQTPGNSEGAVFRPSIEAETQYNVAAGNQTVCTHRTDVATGDGLLTLEMDDFLPFDEFLPDGFFHGGSNDLP